MSTADRLLPLPVAAVTVLDDVLAALPFFVSIAV